MWREREDFMGAKIMVFLGPSLLVLRRDHTPGIPWPGCLDLPGGGREGRESPLDCALRELEEETGLRLDPALARFVHRRIAAGRISYFFAAHAAPELRRDVVFGGEGAGLELMTPVAFAGHADAIPHFARIVGDYVAALGGEER